MKQREEILEMIFFAIIFGLIMGLVYTVWSDIVNSPHTMNKIPEVKTNGK